MCELFMLNQCLRCSDCVNPARQRSDAPSARRVPPVRASAACARSARRAGRVSAANLADVRASCVAMRQLQGMEARKGQAAGGLVA